MPDAGTTARTYRPDSLVARTAKTLLDVVVPASEIVFVLVPDDIDVLPDRLRLTLPMTCRASDELPDETARTPPAPEPGGPARRTPIPPSPRTPHEPDPYTPTSGLSPQTPVAKMSGLGCDGADPKTPV